MRPKSGGRAFSGLFYWKEGRTLPEKQHHQLPILPHISFSSYNGRLHSLSLSILPCLHLMAGMQPSLYRAHLMPSLPFRVQLMCIKEKSISLSWRQVVVGRKGAVGGGNCVWQACIPCLCLGVGDRKKGEEEHLFITYCIVYLTICLPLLCDLPPMPSLACPLCLP